MTKNCFVAEVTFKIKNLLLSNTNQTLQIQKCKNIVKY